MIFGRQKCLLALLAALDGEVGNLDFQMLLFLYCSDVEETPTFEFVPSKYGGFSFTSFADKRRLIEQGLLADEERAWKLTPAGRETATVPPLVRMDMDQFAERHAGLRGDALVAEACRRHPYHAIRSDLPDRVLHKDAKARAAIAAARPSPSQPGLCTIGYEGSSFEGYLNRLLRAGATLLCDVRRNPLSRKYGFSKSALSKGCEGVGLRYEHLPELGIASEERRDLHTQADYDALFETYERESLPKQAESLAKIRGWIQESHRVALTCFERLPEQCHRHCVAEAVEKITGKAAVHL